MNLDEFFMNAKLQEGSDVELQEIFAVDFIKQKIIIRTNYIELARKMHDFLGECNSFSELNYCVVPLGHKYIYGENKKVITGDMYDVIGNYSKYCGRHFTGLVELVVAQYNKLRKEII